MAQAVGRRPLTAMGRVRALIRPCGICCGTEIGFFASYLVFPCQCCPTWTPYSYMFWGDEQQACWWWQFRDIISPPRHEHHRHQTVFLW
jgi:hypothetical protein